jgi:hypothetical protein
MRKSAVLVILSMLVTVPALAQEVAGDWIGQRGHDGTPDCLQS